MNIVMDKNVRQAPGRRELRRLSVVGFLFLGLCLGVAERASAHEDPPGCTGAGTGVLTAQTPTGHVQHGDTICYSVLYGNHLGTNPCQVFDFNADLLLPSEVAHPGSGTIIPILRNVIIDPGEQIQCPGNSKCERPNGDDVCGGIGYAYVVDHADEVASTVACGPPPLTSPGFGVVAAQTSGAGRAHTDDNNNGLATACAFIPNDVFHGGACCDLCTGECVDGVPENECASPRIFTPDATCEEVGCTPAECNACEVCDPATGDCNDDPAIDCNACETCDPDTGACEPSVSCNACETCNPDTGACEPSVSCNACETCDPDTGACEPSVSCADPVCDECNPSTGQCVPRNPQPAECAGGCLHRTPGFWGTHPHITLLFLPLSNCGLEINTTCADGGPCPDEESAEDCSAPPDGSSAEEMCFSNSRDARGNETSPQQLQLIRQCMAAELNMAASVDLGGSCESETIESELIGSIMDRCCRDADSVCRGETCGQEISESRCIDVLDAFNNSPDTLEKVEPFISPGPALSCDCSAANGNGFVNPGRSLGASKCERGELRMLRAVGIGLQGP